MPSPAPPTSARPRGRRAPRRLAAALLAVASLAGLPAAPTSAGEDGGSLKAHYDEVLGEEVRLLSAIERHQAERARLAAEITAVDARIQEATVVLLTRTAELQVAEFRTRLAEAALRRAEKRVADGKARLRSQIVTSYVRGGVNEQVVMAVLRSLEEGEKGRLEASRSYARVVVDHQHDVIGDLRDAQAARGQRAEEAVAVRGRAQALRDEIDAQRKGLQLDRLHLGELHQQAEQTLYAETAALSELQSRKAQIEARVVALEKASDGVQQLLASVQREQPQWKPGDIEFVQPLEGAPVVSEFGMRHHPILNYVRLHAGLDVDGAPGEPIHAAADGLVVLAEPRGGYGNTVVIDHGFSVATLYAHQSSVAVRGGEYVEKGDVIGFVGSTGLSTGPHLHLEVRLRGIPVDPRTFIVDLPR